MNNRVVPANSCSFQHAFRPVEKKAAEERVILHNEQIKNAQAKDQYSFDNTSPDVLNGFSNEKQYSEVPYSINREYLQIRPGMIYNTIKENCKKEFDEFFKNAGSR